MTKALDSVYRTSVHKITVLSFLLKLSLVEGSMDFAKVLVSKRAAILSKWFDRIVDTYPEETARFLRKERDPFANPVGRSIRDGMAGIIDRLFKGGEPSEITPFLDEIIRIRAIQDFSPSQALSFIFDLKEIIREELLGENRGVEFLKQLMLLESRIDDLASASFDVYAGCREQLYKIRIKETTQRVNKLLERVNKIWEKRGQAPISEE